MLAASLLIVGAACAVLVAASVANAGESRHPRGEAPYLPPAGTVFAGLTGTVSIVPFEHLVRFHPPVFERFITWDTNTDWLATRRSIYRIRLGVAMVTQTAKFQRGVISPRGIALGHSDGFLVDMNRNMAHSDRVVYVRIMPEMNGWWNAYCPFNENGSKRGKSHWVRFFIAAWRRTVLILRGGPVRKIDQRLHALRLPPIRGPVSRRTVLPHPKVAFMWVPMTAGSPEIRQLEPQNFWPGKAYVDWVGTDTFSPWVRFTWLDQFYRRFGGKPFEIAEWAVKGRDDPGFVRAMFAWVRAHPRVRMLNYFGSYTRTSPYNPVHYPKSVAALHHGLLSPLFPQYAPEYMPKCSPLLRLKRLCTRW